MKANLLEHCLRSTNPESELRKNYPHIDWDGNSANILVHLKKHKQLISEYDELNKKRTTLHYALFCTSTILMAAVPLVIILGCVFILPLCTTALALTFCLAGIIVTGIVLAVLSGTLIAFSDEIVDFFAKNMNNPYTELSYNIPLDILNLGEFRLFQDYTALCHGEDINIVYFGFTYNANYTQYANYQDLVDTINIKITSNGQSDMILENVESRDLKSLEFLNNILPQDVLNMMPAYTAGRVQKEVDAAFPNLSEDCRHYITTMLRCANMAPTSQELLAM